MNTCCPKVHGIKHSCFIGILLMLTLHPVYTRNKHIGINIRLTRKWKPFLFPRFTLLMLMFVLVCLSLCRHVNQALLLRLLGCACKQPTGPGCAILNSAAVFICIIYFTFPESTYRKVVRIKYLLNFFYAWVGCEAGKNVCTVD